MSVFDGFVRPPCDETLGWQLVEADPDTGVVRVMMEGKREFCKPGGSIQGMAKLPRPVYIKPAPPKPGIKHVLVDCHIDGPFHSILWPPAQNS